MEAADLYRRTEEALEAYVQHISALVTQTQQAELTLSRVEKLVTQGEDICTRLAELEQRITGKQDDLDQLGRELVGNLETLGKQVARENQILGDRIELVRLSSQEQVQQEAAAREQIRVELGGCIQSLTAQNQRANKALRLLGWALAATWVTLVGAILILI